MRKISLLLCVLLLVGSLTACGSNSPAEQSGAEKKVEGKVLKIGHIRPADAVADIDLKAFGKNLEEKSEGSLKLEIYPASQLGDYTVVQERVSIGDIEMQLAPLGTNLDKRFGISNAPYLVENWEQAKNLYSSEGKLVQAMAELLDKNDIKLLGTYPLYFGGICLVDEPLEPGNPEVDKNLKIRVPPMKSFEKTAEALGYIATPLPWADTFTSMQTGIVEGAIGGGAEAYYSNMRDLIKYYLPVNDHFEMWYLYINKGVWEKLAPEQQKTLQEAAKEMEEKRFKEAEAMEEEYENKLKDLGIKVIEFSDQELSGFAKQARELVWPEVKSDFDEMLFDSITSEIK